MRINGSVKGILYNPVASAASGVWDFTNYLIAQYGNNWPAYVPPGVIATGGTSTTGNGFNQWSFTSTGSNTFTVTQGGTVYYAIVAGGGGAAAGGGGGGGVITGQSTLTAGTYTIVVGTGGSGGTGATTGSAATNGSNSSAFGFTAVGGGNGSRVGDTGDRYGGSGGSGGGGGGYSAAITIIGGVGVAGQGWSGGSNNQNTAAPYPSGGGGGAGGIGNIPASSSIGGAGGTGIGVYLPVSNSTVYYGGGGGGATYATGTGGAGGTGGGGAGSGGGSGTSGTTNTGGGGGGNGSAGSGGAGGSGIVVIWSPIATPAKTPYVQYLAVAGGGGGGGGGNGAGGGGGGVLQGLIQPTVGTTYTVTVGSGGSGGSTGGSSGSNGVNSSISGTGLTTITSIGGGGGGYNGNGSSGGSGGGGGYNSGSGAIGGAGTTGQGYAAGSTTGSSGSGSTWGGTGGGGGYGMIGYNSAGYNSNAGSGGDGFTTYIANPATYSWSNYFSAVSYVSFGNQTNFNLSTNNFTIEAWIYLRSYNSSPNASTIVGNGGSGGFIFYVNTSGNLALSTYGVSTLSQSSGTIPLNTWTHVAATRSSNTFKTYINGTNDGSGTFSTTIANPNATIVGDDVSGTSQQYFIGYISNLRIVNGTTVYTSNFTPSTIPLTAITNTVLLTCQNGSFSDSSANNYTATVTGSPYIASQNPFGASYAGGGAGGASSNVSGGYGGMGGGANSVAGGTGVNANANTGGGGSGAGSYNTGNSYAGGTGGSGIVILAYPSTYAAAASATGSPTLTTANGYNVYKFNASGSITF